MVFCDNDGLTGSGGFTDEGDQVVLDLGESVIVVHHEHVSLSGLAADDSQLRLVHIGDSDHEHAVACEGKTHPDTHTKNKTTVKLPPTTQCFFQ